MRAYFETVKKWGREHYVKVAVGFALILAFLVYHNQIEILEYSGDMVCAGDSYDSDPCIATVKFTALNDTFLYPLGYDPWGRNTLFQFEPGVREWRLQRSWGKGWRDIPLNETCTGTWCGAPNNNGVAYSYAFREGRTYTLRVLALKNDPEDYIKWGIPSLGVDPAWLPVNRSKPLTTTTTTIPVTTTTSTSTSSSTTHQSTTTTTLRGGGSLSPGGSSERKYDYEKIEYHPIQILEPGKKYLKRYSGEEAREFNAYIRDDGVPCLKSKYNSPETIQADSKAGGLLLSKNSEGYYCHKNLKKKGDQTVEFDEATGTWSLYYTDDDRSVYVRVLNSTGHLIPKNFYTFNTEEWELRFNTSGDGTAIPSGYYIISANEWELSYACDVNGTTTNTIEYNASVHLIQQGTNAIHPTYDNTLIIDNSKQCQKGNCTAWFPSEIVEAVDDEGHLRNYTVYNRNMFLVNVTVFGNGTTCTVDPGFQMVNITYGWYNRTLHNSSLNALMLNRSAGTEGTAILEGINLTRDDSLVLDMSFNDARNGVSTVLDASQYENHFGVFGPNITTAGKLYNAYNFTDDDYLYVTDSESSLDLPKNLTLSSWIRKSENTAYAGIISKADAAEEAAHNYLFREDNTGKIMFQFYSGTTLERTTTTSSLDVGVWYHIIARVNKTHSVIYVDGNVASTPESIIGYANTGGKGILIGISDNDGVDYTRDFKGIIDEVRIWNRSLSDAEITAEYERAYSRFYCTDNSQQQLCNINSTHAVELNVSQDLNGQEINHSVLWDGYKAFSYPSFSGTSSVSPYLYEVNVSLVGVSAVADTCTYSGSGSYATNCSDNCIYDSDFHVLGDWNISGTGTLTVNAVIDVDGRFINPKTCKVPVQKSVGKIRVKK